MWGILFVLAVTGLLVWHSSGHDRRAWRRYFEREERERRERLKRKD